MEQTSVYISEDPKLLKWSHAGQLVNACLLIFWSYKLSEKYGGWILAGAAILVVCSIVVLIGISRGDNRFRVSFSDEAFEFKNRHRQEPRRLMWSDIDRISIELKKVVVRTTSGEDVDVNVDTVYATAQEIKSHFRRIAQVRGIELLG